MRVAHIITRLILGGAQENTLLTCQDLIQQHGDDVLLITGPGLGPEGSLADEARARGIPMVILPELRREIHPWRDVASYRSIKRRLADFRPDVVHTHSGKAGLLGRRAAWALHVPAIIHTVHGAPFHPYQNAVSRTFFRCCERYAARRCHAIVSVADAMTEQLVAAGVAPRERFVTVPSGMDVETFLQADGRRAAMRAELGYCDQDIVVGKVARLFHLKGHEDVIEAARRAMPSNERLRFLWVGDGALRTRLEKQIAAAGLTPRFHLTGLVPAERIAPLIAAMDIVVHASLREGLARVLPQALIAGKPVVSYDIDGAREVVVPGETGYLLPPRDVASMAASIQRLAQDPSLRERLGREGQRRLSDRFRHESMTVQLRKLYEKILRLNAARNANGALHNTHGGLK